MLRVRFSSPQVGLHRTVHKVVSTATMRVDIDKARRDVVPLGIDHFISLLKVNLPGMRYRCYLPLFTNNGDILFDLVREDYFPVLYNNPFTHSIN